MESVYSVKLWVYIGRSFEMVKVYSSCSKGQDNSLIIFLQTNITSPSVSKDYKPADTRIWSVRLLLQL